MDSPHAPTPTHLQKRSKMADASSSSSSTTTNLAEPKGAKTAYILYIMDEKNKNATKPNLPEGYKQPDMMRELGKART